MATRFTRSMKVLKTLADKAFEPEKKVKKVKKVKKEISEETYKAMLQYVKEHPNATFDYGFMNTLFQFSKALIKKLEDNGIEP